ncbi:MAG: M48 family metallopeptidase [Pseudomonadota bacterium]
MRKQSLRFFLVFIFAIACSAADKPRVLKPGFNLFSKKQDVALGKEAAAQIEQQTHLVKDEQIQAYVRKVASKLWSQSEADNYPYTMKVVSEPSINAFALPGGPMFVHTGLILAAENEGQLAGVLAHEISHVALRHGTNQASKANLIQLPAMLAAMAAGNSMLGQLAQIGIGVGANSVLLKYSRNAERDADLLGTRLMSKAGYNPLEMARFFEKLEGEGGSRGPQFFSSHPNPGNRVTAVEAEIRLLPRRQYDAETGDFNRIKNLVKRLPEPPKEVAAAESNPASPDAIRPSASFKSYSGGYFEVSHPENWEVFSSRNSNEVLIAPRAGIVEGRDGQVLIGAGFLVNVYQPKSGSVNLERDTEELIRQLVSNNRDMRVESSRRTRWNRQRVILTRLASPSPFQGQAEVDTVMTVARRQGLVYVVTIAPRNLERDLRSAFDSMMRSLRVP